MLREWHAKFNVPQYGVPHIPPQDRRELRVRLIAEEFGEFADASGFDIGVYTTGGTWVISDETREPSIIEAADALADLLYVIYGAALEWGIPVDRVLAEVHRSNMSKIWQDGTVHYRADGMVLKPPTYSPADVKGVLGL